MSSEDGNRAALRRVSATEIEAAVVGQVRALLCQPEIIVGTWMAARADMPELTENETRECPLALGTRFRLPNAMSDALSVQRHGRLEAQVLCHPRVGSSILIRCERDRAPIFSRIRAR
jgi:hypothetical protein